jgi:hypothetical protein
MRYFFRTENGRCYPDDEGTELPDIRAACLEASKVFGDFLKEKPADVWENDNLTVTVSDEAGLTLFILNLSVTVGAVLNGRRPAI